MGESQHTVNIPYDYQVAKHPVTNAQYQLFVDDGGYTEKWQHCWTKAGWAEKIKPQFEDMPWRSPYRFVEPFSLPSYPVVGVSWYEAVAFCRWLTERLRERGDKQLIRLIRLPSEAEWEKAARGTDGLAYPWGNEANPEKLNCKETGVGSTSAIGCLPQGASPYGCHDMAGNVWEWCATKYGKDYPYSLEDEWTDNYLEGKNRRRLRGGSWYSPVNSCVCASRLSNHPLSRNYGLNSLGFRLFCSHFLRF
jgi:formylglycine-generating enzyme required for sulfatase activity